MSYSFEPRLAEGFSSGTIETAMRYAVRCHAETNHHYDGMPYAFHLQMVYDFGCRYAHLLPAAAIDTTLAGCWVHDTIEDCRQTYNDVKKHCGETVAELAYALTNEKGRNRKERAGERYYTGIRATSHAAFVKVCDRLANVQHSKNKGNSMLAVYRKEYPAFRQELWSEPLDEMFRELEALCGA